MTASRKESIIKAIGDKARALTPAGSKIILFGSRARGDARQDSDWDILILLDKERISLKDYDAYSYPLRELGWELGENINAILSTKQDWQRNIASPLHYNVENEGITL